MTETLIPLTCKLPTGERCIPRLLVLDALIEAGLGDAIPNGARKHGRPTATQHRRYVRGQAAEMRQKPTLTTSKPSKGYGRKRSRPWAGSQTRAQRLAYIWKVVKTKEVKSICRKSENS